MVTLTRCITIVELLLDGRFIGKPDGVIKVDVSMKNINNKKIISVIDDMLNDVSTLNFDFKAMDLSGFLQQIDKIN
jgi:hypothetical protein